MISNKIKAFLKLKNIKNIDYSRSLKLKQPQAMNTKFMRESFKIQEIILLAKLGNCDIAFIDKTNNEVVMKFTEEDI